MSKKKYAPLQKLWHGVGSTGGAKQGGPGNTGHPVAINLSDQRYMGLAMDSQGQLGMYGLQPTGGIDGRNRVANATKSRIEFYSIATAESAKFLPLDVVYSESFESEWNHESVYGRNDPLSTFSGTKRSISLEFQVGCYGQAEAVANMIEISNLSALMYPSYKVYSKSTGLDGGNASQIEASPLMRVHFNNLILDPSKTTAHGGRNGYAKDVGLVCALDNLTIAPDFEAGVIHLGPMFKAADGGINQPEFFSDFPHKVVIGDNRIYPKVWKVTCSLIVFHTFPLGFHRKEGKNARARSTRGFGVFPWGEKHVYAEGEDTTSFNPGFMESNYQQLVDDAKAFSSGKTEERIKLAKAKQVQRERRLNEEIKRRQAADAAILARSKDSSK